MIPPRVRRLMVARLLRGEPKRWIYYLVITSAWRRYRQLTGSQPEQVYAAQLRRGEVLTVAASKPLPRRLRTGDVRKAMQASARAEADAVSDAQRERARTRVSPR